MSTVRGLQILGCDFFLWSFQSNCYEPVYLCGVLQVLRVHHHHLLSLVALLLRLEHDPLRFSVSIWAWRGGHGAAHRPGAPHSHLHLHRGHWLPGSCRDVLLWLVDALSGLHLQREHLSSPQATGENKRRSQVSQSISVSYFTSANTVTTKVKSKKKTH